MAGIGYQRASLIYNPNAGFLRGRKRLLEQVIRVLRDGGHQVTPRGTSGPGHATQLARDCVSSGDELILVMGGDGSIHEAVNGMAGAKTPLAVLPAGTANVLAMETGLGRKPLPAAARLSELEPARVALGLLEEANGAPRRYFLLMAGAGLDAYVVTIVSGPLKNKLGKAAYWIAPFRLLARRLEEFQVRSEGVARRSSFALASRVRNYGGDLEIAGGASLLSNHFEVVLFEGASPFRYLKYFLGVLTRTATRMSGVTVFQTGSLLLEPAPEDTVHVQLDGEDCGTLPARLRIVPDALTLLLPPGYLARERKRWTTSPTR